MTQKRPGLDGWESIQVCAHQDSHGMPGRDIPDNRVPWSPVLYRAVDG